MTLQETINKDSLAAKKNKDELTAQVLTMVRSAMGNLEIEKKRPLKDPEVIEVLAKEVKQRQDSAQQFLAGGQKDRADKEKEEITVLQKYLPKQLSEAEVLEIVKKAIADTGASSPADMGKVMGKVMPQLKGKADGSLVQKTVKSELTK